MASLFWATHKALQRRSDSSVSRNALEERGHWSSRLIVILGEWYRRELEPTVVPRPKQHLMWARFLQNRIRAVELYDHIRHFLGQIGPHHAVTRLVNGFYEIHEIPLRVE